MCNFYIKTLILIIKLIGIMRIETDLKLGFKDVMIRPKRSTLSSRSQVSLERDFKFLHSMIGGKQRSNYFEPFDENILQAALLNANQNSRTVRITLVFVIGKMPKEPKSLLRGLRRR